MILCYNHDVFYEERSLLRTIFLVQDETFAKLLFTCLHELFDPSTGSLAKSQKLGLRASNSLRFAHYSGPFALPGWVPQKVHDDRSKELFKALKTFKKVLPQVADQEKETTCKAAVAVFYQVEAEDVARRGKILTKFIKNIKWLAGKFDSKTVVLHSFNHLSTSKAPPEFAQAFVEDARERLEQSGYKVTVTPFGYLNEWKLHVAGDSLAKVFKEL